MLPSRIDAFRGLLARQPDHAHARFGLATELAKSGEHAEAVEHFARYLESFDDEGNGWLRYAESLHAIGRTDDARVAIARGLEAAERYGHAGLAADLDALRDTLD